LYSPTLIIQISIIGASNGRSAASLSPPTDHNSSVCKWQRTSRANDSGRRRRKVPQNGILLGAGKDLVARGDARTVYLAALRTLDANENDMKSLLEFARS
jgi:hypothetical protein